MSEAQTLSKQRTLKLIVTLGFFVAALPSLLVSFGVDGKGQWLFGQNEGAFFVKHGCVQCHAVSSLGLKAKRLGPDLSDAVADAPRRFGRSLDDFWHRPSGTMAIVLSSRIRLTEAEKREALAALKLAYQRKLEAEQRGK